MKLFENIDFWAFIISILALIVSIWSQNQNKKLSKETISIAKKDLNRKFFEEIFFSYLTKYIPEEIEKLKDNNYIIENGTEKAINILVDLLDKVSFYSFFDPEFYKKVKNNILEVENILTDIDNCVLGIKDSIYEEDKYKEDKNRDKLRILRDIDLEPKLVNLYDTFKIYYSGY